MPERIPDGTVIMDSWKVLSLIGEGGSGSVYLVRDLQNGKDYALKALSPQAEKQDPPLRESFLREAELQQKIRSPHMIPVRKIIPSGPGGSPCFLMDFIRGIPLNERINRAEPIPFDLALRIAEETASALKKIHEAGYLHLDVKPQNILVEKNGNGKSVLFDLGASKSLKEAACGSGSLNLGTPVYSSPEQCRKGEPLTEKSDVYSLGVCLYLMCARRLPFLFGPVDEVIARVLSEEPAPPKQYNSDIPEELNTLILRMMAKRPGDRFASAADAEKAIRSLRRKLRKGKTHTLLPWILGGLLLSAGAGVLLVWGVTGKTGKRPVPVQTEPEKKTEPEKTAPVTVPEKKEEPVRTVPEPEDISVQLIPEKKTEPVPALPEKKEEPVPPSADPETPEVPVKTKPEKKTVPEPEKKAPPVKKTRKRTKKKPSVPQKTVQAVPAEPKTPPAPVQKPEPAKLDPGEETRKRLNGSQRIPACEGITAAALLEKAALAAQIRLRYVDCPAQILAGSPLIEIPRPVTASEAVRMVLGKIPRLHVLPGKDLTLYVYYGKLPRGRFPNLAVWEQNGQMLTRPENQLGTELVLDRLVLDRVEIRGMPVSFVLGLLRRNTGLSIRTDSLEEEKEIMLQANSVTLRQFCRLFCQKLRCEYRVDERGTIVFYRRTKRMFR